MSPIHLPFCCHSPKSMVFSFPALHQPGITDCDKYRARRTNSIQHSSSTPQLKGSSPDDPRPSIIVNNPIFCVRCCTLPRPLSSFSFRYFYEASSLENDIGVKQPWRHCCFRLYGQQKGKKKKRHEQSNVYSTLWYTFFALQRMTTHVSFFCSTLCRSIPFIAW